MLLDRRVPSRWSRRCHPSWWCVHHGSFVVRWGWPLSAHEHKHWSWEFQTRTWTQSESPAEQKTPCSCAWSIRLVKTQCILAYREILTIRVRVCWAHIVIRFVPCTQTRRYFGLRVALHGSIRSDVRKSYHVAQISWDPCSCTCSDKEEPEIYYYYYYY